MISDAQTLQLTGRPAVRRDITVEVLLNDHQLLERMIIESLRTSYSKRPGRIISYIRDVKGIYIDGYEQKLSGKITQKLKILIANGKVEKDGFGYKLVR